MAFIASSCLVVLVTLHLKLVRDFFSIEGHCRYALLLGSTFHNKGCKENVKMTYFLFSFHILLFSN